MPFCGIYREGQVTRQPVWLRLVKVGSDYRVQCVDESGNVVTGGNILGLKTNSDGTIKGIVRYRNVNEALNMPLNDKKQVQMLTSDVEEA